MVTPSTTPAEQTQEAELLAPFNDMVMGCQKVTFLNSSCSQYTALLGSTMGPKCLSAVSLMWKMVDVARRIRSQADGLVKKCELSLALHQYDLITSMGGSDFWTFPPEAFDDETEKAATLLLRIMLDTTSTSGFLRLRLGDMKAVQKTWEESDKIKTPIWEMRT
ncbi:hypothetical protein LTS14_003980 [Recurvomyces mirabilis]|nr:hypothetical protein LTS14_003980 [Recurvomyces mirabilis]